MALDPPLVISLRLLDTARRRRGGLDIRSRRFNRRQSSSLESTGPGSAINPGSEAWWRVPASSNGRAKTLGKIASAGSRRQPSDRCCAPPLDQRDRRKVEINAKNLIVFYRSNAIKS
jgi:hypothetical protein